jgi:hypothetical protein
VLSQLDDVLSRAAGGSTGPRLGVATVHLVELVFEGTPDAHVLERRVRLFAQLTNMRLQDLDVLLNLIGERR